MCSSIKIYKDSMKAEISILKNVVAIYLKDINDIFGCH